VLDPLTAVAAIVFVLGAVQLFAGALTAGVTIDEPIEADATRSWIDHGWFLPGDALVNGHPDPTYKYANPNVYGPAFGALAHVANVIAGNESIGEISHSRSSYDVRHLVSALLGLLAAVVVGGGAWLLTRSRRIGLWSAAALLAIPEWSGHSFFNPKDIPAGCGYTLVTVALLLALDRQSDDPDERRRRIAIGSLLAGGFFVGAGTRLALIVPFLLSVLVYAALRLGQRRLGGIRRNADADLAVAAGTGLGLASIAVIYPKAAASPVTLLVESVFGSSGFPWRGVTLTAGQLLPEHPPWWYLPAWVGAALPVLIGLLAVLGAVLGVRALLGAWRADLRGPVWSRSDLGLVLVLQQALLLPVGAILVGATMYSGLRQHVYVLPAIAILAGVGAQRFSGWARARKPQETWRPLATALLCVALVAPMIEQALLFPYNYAYVNPIAGIDGIDRRWETDFWVASAPEALSHVPRSAELRCFLLMPTTPCEPDELAPFEDVRGTAVDPKWEGDTAATWVIVRRHAGNVPPDYCEKADDVTRWLRGETITMAYVLRCDPERLAP